MSIICVQDMWLNKMYEPIKLCVTILFLSTSGIVVKYITEIKWQLHSLCQLVRFLSRLLSSYVCLSSPLPSCCAAISLARTKITLSDRRCPLARHCFSLKLPAFSHVETHPIRRGKVWYVCQQFSEASSMPWIQQLYALPDSMQKNTTAQ